MGQNFFLRDTRLIYDNKEERYTKITAVSKIAKARDERQTSLEIRKCGARRPTLDYEENIWSASLFSSSSQRFSRCVLVTLVVAVKMPRLCCPARLAPTRREMERAGMMQRRERERQTENREKKSTIVSFLCNVCPDPSLPPFSFLRCSPAWRTTQSFVLPSGTTNSLSVES